MEGYKYCVQCGNTEGFPETENQDPVPHTCFECESNEASKSDNE